LRYGKFSRRTLAFELGAYGITVNTIAPGRTNPAQILKLHPTEQSRADDIKQNIPAGYFGEPHDIGQARVSGDRRRQTERRRAARAN
jgi:NAD(P)-dependent dehydrogenase (short-subunit alcohol dehydrogenase family)